MPGFSELFSHIADIVMFMSIINGRILNNKLRIWLLKITSIHYSQATVCNMRLLILVTLSAQQHEYNLIYIPPFV